jgi:hypothetical protein
MAPPAFNAAMKESTVSAVALQSTTIVCESHNNETTSSDDPRLPLSAKPANEDRCCFQLSREDRDVSVMKDEDVMDDGDVDVVVANEYPWLSHKATNSKRRLYRAA